MARDARSTGRWLPLLLLICLGSLWGGNPNFAKALALGGMPPVGAVFWLTLGAGIILTCLCVLRRQPIRLDRRHVIYYAVIGGIGISVSWGALILVSGRISASFGSVVVLLSPVLTYVFAVALRIEQPRLLRVLGIAIGFVGAGFLVFPEGSLPSPELVPVALFAIVIPASYATMNVYAQIGRPANADNISLAAGTMYMACIVTGLIGAVSGNFHPLWQGVGREGWILLGFAISTSISFIIYFTLVGLAGAVYMGQVGYLATIMGVTWGIVFFKEQPPVWMWVAIAIVFASVALVNFGGGKKKASS